MKNMKNDCELVAVKNNIDFKWNNKFPINTLYLMRGYISINQDIRKNILIIALMHIGNIILIFLTKIKLVKF